MQRGVPGEVAVEGNDAAGRVPVARQVGLGLGSASGSGSGFGSWWCHDWGCGRGPTGVVVAGKLFARLGCIP
jgi:hypothetical protein